MDQSKLSAVLGEETAILFADPAGITHADCAVRGLASATHHLTELHKAIVASRQAIGDRTGLRESIQLGKLVNGLIDQIEAIRDQIEEASAEAERPVWRREVEGVTTA